MPIAFDETARYDKAFEVGGVFQFGHFENRIDGLFFGRLNKAARIDDHEIGARVIGCDRVALGFELRDDLLGVDEGLRAAERDEAHARRARLGAFSGARAKERFGRCRHGVGTEACHAVPVLPPVIALRKNRR